MRRMRNFAVAVGLAALVEVTAAIFLFGGAALGVVPAWTGLILLYPAIKFWQVSGADTLPAGTAVLVLALLEFAQFLCIFWVVIEILDRRRDQRSRGK